LGRAGALQLILSEDDPVPGVDADVAFDFDRFVTAMNAGGDVVLHTDVRGPGIDETDDRGIWARVAATGEWLKILREGDMLDGRVVSSFGFDITIDHVGARPLNDDRVLVIHVGFTDSTTAIYSVLIPEPASVLLLCVGAATLARQRRFGKIVNVV
jgi:hypothetical protein